MTIYYPAGVFTDEQLSKPVIFEYHYAGTVTASTAQAGFPATAPTNELTYERWRPTALPATWAIDLGVTRSINCCAIAAHTLYYKNIAIQSSTDNATWTTHHSISPTDNSPIIVMFATVSARYWRLSITAGTNATYGATIPSVGVVFFGSYLQMQQRIEVGISPISLSRKTTYSGNTSEGGNWLGRSVKRAGKVGQIPLKMMPRDWYQSTLDPALQRMRYKPFFFASCPKAMPWDVSYCWLTDDPKPVTASGMMMDVTLNVEAHAHE